MARGAWIQFLGMEPFSAESTRAVIRLEPPRAYLDHNGTVNATELFAWAEVPGAGCLRAEMVASSRYDRIGVGYARHRLADPRIFDQILAALGDASRVLDVGAGTGSYEPADRAVVAVEPSRTMIAQRSAGSAPVACAKAEDLPFACNSFDASMAILTLHHWTDKPKGLRELCRVAPRRVILCFDTVYQNAFWLVRDYLPEIAMVDYGQVLSPAQVADAIGADRIDAVYVPWDCVDGFLGAYWRRPERYLEDSVRDQ
jgi:SAM-dependent methyltransferase